MPATRKQGPRWKTARPPGQRPLPAPDHPEQAAHAAATHREPNHMNRAKRATPTVLTATSLAEAWPAPADLRPFRGQPSRARQGANHAANRRRDHRGQPRRRGRQNHRRPRLAARAATRRPVLPHMVRPLGATVLRAPFGHRRPRSGQSSRDHAPSAPLARPRQPSTRRRQHPAVQRPSHPLDGCRPGPAMARPVRRELRFLRKTRPAGRGGANPCRGRRRLSCGPGSFVSTRRSPGQPATEALSARLKSQRQIDTESHDPEKNSASSERGVWRVA